MSFGWRTKSPSDKIPSAHFCIGGRNPLHVFYKVDIIPFETFYRMDIIPLVILQGGQNPFHKMDKIPFGQNPEGILSGYHVLPLRVLSKDTVSFVTFKNKMTVEKKKKKSGVR